ncbi:putative quinol monooxygenase [Pseudoduganella aquatica]|uniref:Antibiotic biosynthesis monooxygenase n=1 Tax=Pseudoduganella aquatica TaxID=2660641 RepID=A0A7X4HHI2_9BURK|nr:antibiotic biosynthesis monooxygenase family protein [Pseudoduganella aquatica]MYN10612.1 antibiotic biosynthesis monooxygenase [Pseudoduganella aquatica]
MSAAGHITVAARWQVKEGAFSEVLAIVAELRPLSLGEPGCLGYEVYQGVDAPNSLLLFERYRDEAALDAHKQSSHYQGLVVGRILPLLEDRRVEFFSAK